MPFFFFYFIVAYDIIVADGRQILIWEGFSMDKKMLFIYNPRAGKAQIRSNLLDIIDIFVKAGYEVTAYPTQASGDAVKAVQRMRH